MTMVCHAWILRTRNVLASVVAALCLGLAAGNALADGQWVSGPSTLTAGEAGSFSGGGYAPGSVVTLRITPPIFQSYGQAIAVRADGTFSHDVLSRVEGVHTIEVLDAQGQVLAASNFAVNR